MFFDDNNNIFNIEINNDRQDNLFNIDEGFNKGNIFKNEYKKYKNYIYKIKTNNKKDELLYKIQSYTFFLKDLNLYLDINNKDTYLLNKFNEINVKLNDLKKEYINNYGPLCIEDSNDNNNWEWIKNPWPWDKGDN